MEGYRATQFYLGRGADSGGPIKINDVLFPLGYRELEKLTVRTALTVASLIAAFRYR